MSGAFLAQRSNIFIWTCVQGEATVWPPSRGVATHPTSLTKGTACLPAPSQVRSRGRDPGPQRFLKFLPLLSGKGPARARQPGGQHLDSRGLPCDPISLRPGDPNTILDQTVAQRKAYSEHGLGSTEGPPGLSVDRALQGGTHRTGQLHTQARRAAGPRPPHAPTRCGAPLQCRVDDSRPPAPVAPRPPPGALTGLSLCGGAAVCLVALRPHGPAALPRDPNLS